MLVHQQLKSYDNRPNLFASNKNEKDGE